MIDNNMSDKRIISVIISAFGITASLFFTTMFFIISYSSPSLFHRIGSITFGSFSFTTAMAIASHQHSSDDVIGLCYTNIMGFCMVFGIEKMFTDDVLGGLITFLFGLVFFMTWLLTIKTFWSKKKLQIALNCDAIEANIYTRENNSKECGKK